MIGFAPLLGYARKIARLPIPDITARATESWVIAPETTKYVPPALFLPDQLEKIGETEFTSRADVLRSFQGDFDTLEGPTMGYRLKDVDLVDGVLYVNGAQRHLRAKRKSAFFHSKPAATTSGALYETWLGNRWFGNWLSDDCLSYRLAEDAGQPITTAASPSGHVPQYEEKLGMAPKRIGHVHFEELCLFDDGSNNADKSRRAKEMREALLVGIHAAPVPGVYLSRGKSGDARVLENERDIEEYIQKHLGFKVLDPTTASIEEIAQTCGNAAIVAGVEGSHLVHGLSVMPEHATLLVIQPPNRTVSALKILTDRRAQRYAFVVADGTNTQFRVAPDTIMRTIDLIQ